MKKIAGLTLIVLLSVTAACNLATSAPTEPSAVIPTIPPTASPTTAMVDLPAMTVLSIFPARDENSKYISLSVGGDVDTEIVDGGRRTGNGQALASDDGNTVPDSYIQFNVSDAAIFAGYPTSSIRLDVEYLDEGTDSFTVQYDAASGGPYGDGTFLESWPVFKTDSGSYRTSTFIFKNIYFGNRDNGADFRISDQADGPETIHKVSITLLPNPTIINVDDCGASPLDDIPDSKAIQSCINKAKSGDIITFTSGENSFGYKGYLIDKTIFLNISTPRSYLTFTSTNPANPALLKATADLKGFVMKLYSRSSGIDPAAIDYTTISYLHLDGNREERTCVGTDEVANGVDDNWGSWLLECRNEWDSWCMAGTLDLAAALDWSDSRQNYALNPQRWTTGSFIEGLHITDTECGTAFGLGGAGSTIYNNVIETAGDHVHAALCTSTDETYEFGDWSDGITFVGPGHQVLNNTVVNPSDVGIVFFGGRNTVIRGNTIQVTPGNYGAFAGIAIHPWSLGDISFGQVTGNTVIGEGDETCGNLHTGINIGTHMWGGACLGAQVTPAIGLPGCSFDPAEPEGALCPPNAPCQLWASVAQEDAAYLLTDNLVRGAHINYLIEGLDLVGALIESNNVSETPRMSDWQAARSGCDGPTWGPLDKVAHHPSLPGWTDLRVHCER